MKHYKVCKYDYSSKDYLDEWTGLWDFIDPNTLNGEITEQYRVKERDYINFALSFLVKFDLSKFRYTNMQDDSSAFGEDLSNKVGENLFIDLGSSPASFENQPLDFCRLTDLLKLSLRNIIWFKIVHEEGYYLSFADDYYWLIGVPDSLNVEGIAKDNGLFAYETSDPWE